MLSGCASASRRARGSAASSPASVTLKLRYTDFHTHHAARGRSRRPASTSSSIASLLELYREARTRPLPIRLLGVALAKLRLDAVQLPLFDDDDRRGVAVDRVRDRFGYHAIHLATTLGRDRRDRR